MGTERNQDDDLRAIPRAPVDLSIGEILAGKYATERLLGRGGMGTVWLCTHLGLGERVAVKVMSRAMAENAEIRARFQREARASAKIKSRYVARVHDTGELADGRPFLVMEYMEGETLAQSLRGGKKLSLVDTAKILGQVGRGLARAHELGIVHRDIKPDNVFLAHTSDDGVIAKVFDFGIVKLFDTISPNDDATQEGALLGTPQYMSPEQVDGITIDLRSDIYSLGVMAYRMLVGARLFNGESLSAMLMQICTAPLPRLTELLPDLPPAVDTWFQKTCARDRESRYVSVVECVDALSAAAGIVAVADVTLPLGALSNGQVSISSPPLDTATGVASTSRVSVVPSRASTGDPTPPPAPTLRARQRRVILMLVGGAAVALFLLVLSTTHGGTSKTDGALPASHAAADRPTIDPATLPVASAPVVAPAVAAPAPSPVVVAPPASTPDAAPRTIYRSAPPRRTFHPAPSRTEPTQGASEKPGDDRIHDVGY